MGSSGCSLCGDVSAQEHLTPRELEVIRGHLTSINIDTTAEETSVFCEVCRNLLEETNRLHVLLQMVTSQLACVVAKVKVKFERRAVCTNDRECLPSQCSSCETEDAASNAPHENLRAESFPWETFPFNEEKFIHDETISNDVEGTTRFYSLICGKSSTSPGDLSTHNESFHSSHLNFLCLSCDPLREFFSEDLLKAHAVIHSSSVGGPFLCSLCSSGASTFETPSDLDNHLLRLHTHSSQLAADWESCGVEEPCDELPISLSSSIQSASNSKSVEGVEVASSEEAMVIISVSSLADGNEEQISCSEPPPEFTLCEVPSSSQRRKRRRRKSVPPKEPRKKRAMTFTAPVMRNGFKLYVCGSCDVGHQTSQQKYACCTRHGCPYCGKKYTRPCRLNEHISKEHQQDSQAKK